ncbi:hypothetical protein OIO90_006068 [Microbotryomycetes sp. JL221]|nr:hypothetical protein OIO90_006068 [Microbotryomycetes sp. JL221]
MAVLQQSDWFDDSSVLHPLAVGGATLLVVWLYLRLTSTRSLNPTSIFSWLVSVALGSTVSRIITQPELNFVRGLLSIFILFLAEWISTFLPSNVSAPFTFLFKNPPVLLVFRGQADAKAMKRHRIAPSGLMQALRTKGLVRLDQAEVIVLEGNGAFSVIPLLSDEDRNGHLEALENVPGYARMCRELCNETRYKTTEPRLIHLGLNQGRKASEGAVGRAEP